jgi:hypothetical protein
MTRSRALELGLVAGCLAGIVAYGACAQRQRMPPEVSLPPGYTVRQWDSA